MDQPADALTITDPLPISVVVLAKNEATSIERCLNSVAWCAERVVIDDGSTDETVALAERCGARVVSHKFTSFASQRNFALDSANLKHEWVLHLDADECGTESLRVALEAALKSATPETAAFRMCRKTMFFGRWLKYADGFPVWIMRLVRRGKSRFVDSGHGEVPVPPVDGTIATLSEPFVHYPFNRGLSDWYARHNNYATREAEYEFSARVLPTTDTAAGDDAAARRRRLRNFARRLPCRPALRFFYQYIFKWGFLDGRPGLMFCMLMAFYEQMIVYKRRELEFRARGGQP